MKWGLKKLRNKQIHNFTILFKMAIKIRSKKDKIRMACTTKGEERKIDIKIRFEDLKERGHVGYSGVDWKRELK